ncbi:hypothetical protein DF161_33940 [Burkholderia stagnalis]|nr:hypothetical protein DF161_33940 [Burkholderia stagnalis]
MNGDWWKIVVFDYSHRLDPKIEQCAKELRAMLLAGTPQGQAEQNARWRRLQAARDDKAYQAFKALIPGLVPPKRSRDASEARAAS